jgi:hypothetical protein
MARHHAVMDIPKTKRELAAELLTDMFRDRTRVLIADAIARAAEQNISRRTLIRAKTDLGLREIHNGPYSGIWEWPTQPGERHAHAALTSDHAGQDAGGHPQRPGPEDDPGQLTIRLTLSRADR